MSELGLDELNDDQVLQAATAVFEELAARQAWEGAAPGWEDAQVFSELLSGEAAAEGARGVEGVLDGSNRAGQAALAREVLGALRDDPRLAPLVDDAVAAAHEQHLAPPALLVGAALFLVRAAIVSVDVELERDTPGGKRHLKLKFEPDKLEDYLKQALLGPLGR